MKHIQVIVEGAADEAVEELQGHTPLEVARCPQLDRLAASGATGLLALPHEGLDARNEVFLGEMAGLPKEDAMQLRRGPLEALSLHPEQDVDFCPAYSGQFVTLDGEWLRDCDVHGLSLKETMLLAELLSERLGDGVRIEVLEPNRVVVLLNAEHQTDDAGYAPCLADGERWKTCMSSQRRHSRVRELFEKSREILESCAVNDVRLDLGENPAHALWLWGGGHVKDTWDLLQKRSSAGLCVSQAPMARGLAGAMGWTICDLSLRKEGEIAFNLPKLVEHLRKTDTVLIYVPAEMCGGRFRCAAAKVKHLELLDHRLIAPLMDVLSAHVPYRLLVTADGVVSTEKQRPTSGMIPFVMTGEGLQQDAASGWDEVAAAKGYYGRTRIRKLMELFWKES